MLWCERNEMFRVENKDKPRLFYLKTAGWRSYFEEVKVDLRDGYTINARFKGAVLAGHATINTYTRRS